MDRNRGVEVYFLSKYTPKRVAIYGLPGVLNYANSMMVIEYPNLVIFNLYSQDSRSLAVRVLHVVVVRGASVTNHRVR